MFLPYKAKNPPESVPYVTIGLIVTNVIVFLCTSSYSDWTLPIRQGAIDDLALTFNNFNVWRLFTSLFTHGDIFHIGGNMLFLWLFGASVEGRLRSGKFAILYFGAGIIASLSHEFVQGMHAPDVPSFGASGAIMGVAGAYLYMFPFSHICIFRWWLFRFGVLEWQARWLVAFYVGQDLLLGLLLRGGDGVAHFAHVGGFASGVGICFLMKPHRDDERLSQIQKTRSETKDMRLIAFHELDHLLKHDTDNVDLILTYCEKGMLEPNGQSVHKSLLMIQRYQGMLIDRADPTRLANILLQIAPGQGHMPSLFYLKLGSKLEGAQAWELACRIYRQIYDRDQKSMDSEAALYRIGRIMETVYKDLAQASAAYSEVLRLFPAGSKAIDAARSLKQIQFEQSGGPVPRRALAVGARTTLSSGSPRDDVSNAPAGAMSNSVVQGTPASPPPV